MNLTLSTRLSASLEDAHLNRPISRVRDRTATLYNRVSVYWEVNKANNGQGSIYVHTYAYVHIEKSTKVSRRQSLPQESTTMSFQRRRNPPHSLQTGYQDFLHDRDRDRTWSELVAHIHDKCAGSNFFHKSRETRGSLETRQETPDFLVKCQDRIFNITRNKFKKSAGDPRKAHKTLFKSMDLLIKHFYWTPNSSLAHSF